MLNAPQPSSSAVYRRCVILRGCSGVLVHSSSDFSGGRLKFEIPLTLPLSLFLFFVIGCCWLGGGVYYYKCYLLSLVILVVFCVLFAMCTK